MIITEQLLFAVHKGFVSSRPAGIIGSDHCLPIACSHHSWEDNPDKIPYAEYGFYALWESSLNVEAFFESIYLHNIEGGKNPNGLYVYTVSYDPKEVVDDSENWEHLQGGDLRRPTQEELLPLTEDKAPWSGVVF